jgi:eukaryotic-like serine/threonine-protein kinase
MPGEPSLESPRRAGDTSMSALCGLGARRTEDSLDERLSLVATARELGAPIEPAALGRFTVARILGRGGQGCLYEGFDGELQRRVALKIPRYAHGGAHDDLTFEARALAQVRHPNLVTVYALEHCEGRPIVVMELVVGTPLAAWVTASRPSTARILEVIAKVGDGLSELHRAGLTHRDVKPANILVDAHGQPRLVDLGLAAFSGAAAVAAGTPSYAAPEQRRHGTVDPAADQYGLAATLAAVLVLDGPRGAVSRSARVAIARALAEEPAARHRDVASFVKLLRAGPRRRRVLAGVGTAMLAGAGVVLAAWPSSPAVCPRDPAALQQRVDELRASMRAHLEALPASIGPESFEPTAAALDGYAQRWSEAVTLVCSGPTGNRWEGPRAQCLDDGAFELDTVLGEIVELDEHTASAAPRIAAALPRPERCVDTELAQLAPVVDHADQLALRRQLSVVDRRCRYGLTDDCAAQYDALAHDAVVQGIDACVWEPQLAFGRASSAQYRGQPEAVATALREAQWAGERCGDDRVKLDAQRVLAEQIALYDGDAAGALDQLHAAEATLARMGRPISQEIALLASRATAMLAVGKPELAATAAARAVELHAGLRGGALEERAQLLGLHSNALYELGEGDRARALQRESLALRERELGPSHPTVAHALANLAVSYETVDPAQARVLNRRAVAIFSAHPSGHELPLAMCLTHQSGFDLEAGDLAEARAANARALALFAAAGAPDHPFAGDALVIRAELLAADGEHHGALATAERAVAILEQTRGSDDATTVAAKHGRDVLLAADHEGGGE